MQPTVSERLERMQGSEIHLKQSSHWVDRKPSRRPPPAAAAASRLRTPRLQQLSHSAELQSLHTRREITTETLPSATYPTQPHDYMAIPHHITHCIAAPNPLKKFPQSHTKWNNSEKVILGFSSAPCTLSFLCTQQFPSPLFHKELTYTHHPPPEGGRNRAMHASSRATTRKYIYLPKDCRQRLKDNPSSPHTNL